MPRVKGGPKTRQRRKKWLKLAKGYRGKLSKCYRIARPQVMQSLAFAYRERKKKKRRFRQLAILQINARCRELGLPYNKFMHGLKRLNIKLNRMQLARLARDDPDSFTELVEKVKTKK
jgi:large subunit ribosomal protein L20